jgi:carboxypeptidase PM20D1
MIQFALANPWLMRGIITKQLQASATTNSFIRTTQAVTMVSGGMKDNVLPRDAKAVINYRLYPGDTLRSVYEHTVDAIGNLPVKIKPIKGETLEGVMGWEASPVSDSETPQFQNLARLIRQVFPGSVAGPYLVAGATDARYYAPICPAVFRFCPIQMVEGDLERMHGVNERLSIENCSRMVTFFIEFIKIMSKAE